MSRAAAIGGVLVVAAVLQTALFPYLGLAGFRPDLLLVATAAFAFRDGPMTGTLVGFAAGVLGDLLHVQPAMGVYPAVLVAVGYGVGIATPYLAEASLTAPLAIAFSTAVAATVGYGILSRLLGDPRYSVELLARGSVAVALYNTLVAPAVFWVVAKVSRRLPPARTVVL